jgi:hypothetical protein
MFDPFSQPFPSNSGWGRDRRVNEVIDDVARLKQAQADSEALAQEVRRLLLVTESMWRILQDEHGYDDETLRKKMAEIQTSRSRGTTDGAKSSPPCAKCGRPLARRLPRCIYCGAEHAVSPFEA